MSSKHFLITLLFVAFQVANGQDRGECIDDTQEHIQFLKNFYTEYLSVPDDVSSYLMQKDILKKFCEQSLLDNISKIKLDYDPFIFAQDFWSGVLRYLKVKKYGTKKNVYKVSFHYLNKDDSDRIRIRLKVINTTEVCKISDIISVYDKEKGLHFPLGR